MSHITRTGMFLAVALAFALPAQNGQYSEGRPTGGPFTRNTILGAPFSAEAPGRLVVERVFNGDGTMALPVGKECFQFPPPVVPRDGSDSERLRAVNAQLSPDLGIVIASHRSDAIGTVDYRVINIRREEPPEDLFEVPFDYTRMASDQWTGRPRRWCRGPVGSPAH